MLWTVIDVLAWFVRIFVGHWPRSFFAVVGFLLSLLIARLADTPTIREMWAALLGIPVPLAVAVFYLVVVGLGTLVACGALEMTGKPMDKD